jgi:hypothetical protein
LHGAICQNSFNQHHANAHTPHQRNTNPGKTTEDQTHANKTGTQETEEKKVSVYVSRKTAFHECRATNHGGSAVRVKPRLQVPPVSSPLWKLLNENLEASLGLEFTPRDIEAKSTAELAEAFGRIVYESMATLFEEKKTHVPHVERKKPANLRLQELRALKKDLRKSRKKMLRSGEEGTEAERIINKRWFEVMHEHAKLSKLLQARDLARRNTKKQTKFRANHEIWEDTFREICFR